MSIQEIVQDDIDVYEAQLKLIESFPRLEAKKKYLRGELRHQKSTGEWFAIWRQYIDVLEELRILNALDKEGIEVLLEGLRDRLKEATDDTKKPNMEGSKE